MMNIAQYQHKARGCIKYTGNTFPVNGKHMWPRNRENLGNGLLSGEQCSTYVDPAQQMCN